MSDFCKATECKCYAAMTGNGPVVPHTITRRAMTPTDVAIDIKYAGICHSDIHQVREEWGKAIFPMVPGHEISGVVAAVGTKVTKFKVGDLVGVGCMVDSCPHCSACKQGLEQYCEEGPTFTYNSKDRTDNTTTFGGYSERIIVPEKFLLQIPEGLDLKGAAPLLCAGITTWSPLRH